MSNASSFVFQLSHSQIELFEQLEIQGKTTPIQHARFSAKQPGLNITLYKSGKLLIQGKKAQEWIHFHLEPYVLQDVQRTQKQTSSNASSFENYGEDCIGADETGKGDYFGPLCLCALYIPKEFPKNYVSQTTAMSTSSHSSIKHIASSYKSPQEYLLKLKIQDSKKIADTKIKTLAAEIRRLCIYTEKVLSPPQYNTLYKKIPNLNALMRYLHKTNISDLLKKVHNTLDTTPQTVMVDQFCRDENWLASVKKEYPQTQVLQETKAEKHLSVACASIVARDRFLTEMHLLSKQAQITLPKGAGSQVDLCAKTLLNQILSSSSIRITPANLPSIMEPWVKWHFANSKKLT